MREHVRRYVEQHEPVGGFLLAVLANNLVEAFAHADSINSARMYDWANWLYNDAPRACWGSHEIVTAWIAEKEAK